jgi:thiamine-phosphate pyrophosphorylase
MTLPRFYPIVDSAAWVVRLVAAGARLVQLRLKDQDEATVRSEIRRSLAACAAANAQLVVNDYWQIAIDERATYVHLGQQDLDSADVAALRRANIRLGVSTHDHAELERALTVAPDYIALGPIYPTTLKVMPWAPQGLARITEWKQRIAPLPLVAIGGLTAERLPAVFAAGADSAAVVSDITRHAEPEARTREWLAITAAA